jgi:hypothetical protein
MRDINLYSRDLYGKVTFGFNSVSSKNSNFEILLQKVQTLTLSESKKTYFSNIIGGEINSIGKFNFGVDGYGDFKAVFSSNLLLVKKKIQADELINNIPVNDKIKSLELKDVIFDQKNLSVLLSIYVSTNNSNSLIKLPVK